jgi:hypothetical protein
LVCVGFFWDRVPQTICPGWAWTMIPLISVSQIAKIIAMSRQHLLFLVLNIAYCIFDLFPFRLSQFTSAATFTSVCASSCAAYCSPWGRHENSIIRIFQVRKTEACRS